jgi:hypothetical protein
MNEYKRLPSSHRHATEANQSIPVVVPNRTSCFTIDCSSDNSSQSMQAIVLLFEKVLAQYFAIYFCSSACDCVSNVTETTSSTRGKQPYHGYTLTALQQQQESMRSANDQFDPEVLFDEPRILKELRAWHYHSDIKDLKKRFTSNKINHDINKIGCVVCIPLMVHNPGYTDEFKEEGGVFGVDRGGIFIPYHSEDVARSDGSSNYDNDSEEDDEMDDKETNNNEDNFDSVRDG